MNIERKAQAYRDRLDEEHDAEMERAAAIEDFLEELSSEISIRMWSAFINGDLIPSRVDVGLGLVRVTQELEFWDQELDPPMQWFDRLRRDRAEMIDAIVAYANYFAAIEAEKFSNTERDIDD